MVSVFQTVLALSCGGTILFIFLKTLKMAFQKYVLKRWLYCSSLLGAFFFIIPFWKMELLSYVSQAQPFAALENISVPLKISLTNKFFLSSEQDWTWSIAWLWAIIAMILIVVYVFRYKQFLKEILQICDYINTPILVGLFHNYIFLPKVNAVEENRYILLHELHHLKHADRRRCLVIRGNLELGVINWKIAW